MSFPSCSAVIPHRRYRHLLLFACLLGTDFLIGCTKESDTNEVSDPCAIETLPLQSRNRFRTGETFYLPTAMKSADCGTLEWNLVASPEANLNELVDGKDGYQRLTPHIAGQYSFSATNPFSGEVVQDSFVAVDASARPFQNYNYYPWHSMVEVGSEVWVADVYSPTISRLNKSNMANRGSITVGSWPVSLVEVPSRSLVLVANKASDTLGFVDTFEKRQVDAVWVGDAPAGIVVSPDGLRAYVSLSGEDKVAVVDVVKRELIERIDALFDPLALALTPDGKTLFVASHRSGQSSQYPYEGRDPETETDIAIIDTQTNLVTGFILEVSSTINDMFYDGARDELWVVGTRNDTVGSLNDPSVFSFIHEVVVLSPEAGQAKRLRSIDLSRESDSSDMVVTLQGGALCGDTVWVTAESSDLTIALDAVTFAEKARIPSAGRPRSVMCLGQGALVHSAVDLSVVKIEGSVGEKFSTGAVERRPESLIAGHKVFSMPGEGPGANRSCSNCHVDGQSDGVVWNAGPFPNAQVTRPFRWLEGTSRIGWDGYVGSIKVSGFVGGSTINSRPNTEQAEALGDFLASLMPGPAANGKTRRDGSLSEEALKGKAIFDGKAACTVCHSGPATTNREMYEDGLTPGKTDVPSLVDVSRVGSWLKDGSAATLKEAVDVGLEAVGVTLTEQEHRYLMRYLEEITAREFFVLTSNFSEQGLLGAGQKIKLTFNAPVFDDALNLTGISLKGADGTFISLGYEVDNRHVTLRPVSPLDADSRYVLVVSPELESDSGLRPSTTIELPFKTAKAPELRLEGEYQWVVSVPMLDFANQTFDPDNAIDATVPVQVTSAPGGGTALFDLGMDLIYTSEFVIDGFTFMIPDLPVPAGPSFGNGSALKAGLFDADGDGIADGASGTLALSGPAFDVEGVQWRLQRPPQAPGEGGCEEETTGPNSLQVERTESGVVISWEGANAIGLYVTSPEAALPGGPGQTVTGGQAYWVLEYQEFPAGFAGPVTYGVVAADSNNASERHGAPAQTPELVAGTCYKFSVVTNAFQTNSAIIKW